MTKNDGNIGDRLKLIREKNNLSLVKLAKIFDITKQTLLRYESGERRPTNDFVEKFGRKFKLSGDWLLYGIPPVYRLNGKEQDAQATFLELSEMLAEITGKVELPESFNSAIDKIGEGTPQNYVTLLYYMKNDPELRQKIFQMFHIMLKPIADSRMASTD